MSDYKRFTPTGPSVSLAADTSSDRVSVPFPTASTIPGVDSTSLLISNLGPDHVYIETAASNATAVVGTSFPVLAESQILIKRKSHTSIAGICPASTATVIFTPGDGG